MKRLILLSVIAWAGFWTCHQGSSNEEQKSENIITGSTAEDKEAGKFKPANAPGLTQPVLMLVDQYWKIEGYVDMKDNAEVDKNMGRWYNFKKDGTFESGRANTSTAKGSWTFDENSKTLHIDSNVDVEDAEYSCRFSASGNTLIFIGTKTYKQTHIQGKMEKVESIQ